jgi:hypothetical protein
VNFDDLIAELKAREKNKAYLGTPFSHQDLRIRLQRFYDVSTIAGVMTIEGITVFSPVTHFFPQILHTGYPKISLLPSFWEPINRTFLEWADLLIVYKADGWEQSVGLRYEIASAETANKPIFYLDEGVPTIKKGGAR